MLHLAARRYVGVPFRHQGRNPASAIDCVGLLVVAARDLGWGAVLAQDRADYARNPHAGLLERHLAAAFGPPIAHAPVALDALQPGDVLAMRGTGDARHVAIAGDYAHGGLSMIHTSSAFGRVVEHRIDDALRRLIVQAYRPQVPA